MSLDYEEMLKRGLERIPESLTKFDRFEIPKVRGHLQGNKTIVSNFKQIVSVINRPEEHVLKYILKELAAPGEMNGQLFIIGTKISAGRVNDKIRQYAHDFVICRDCGKPDTTIVKEGNLNFLKCQACGAKHPIRAKV